jgi:eukaryotic-like serine/threonine-protein kinase
VTSTAHGRMTVTPGTGELVLAGSIDESSELDKLLGRATGNVLVLDLAGVTFINSLGVRDWIRMLAAAAQRGITVELHRVSEPVIHQLNMIVATRAHTHSFYGPYACDRCGREESMLIDVDVNEPTLAQLQPPPMTCPECGSAMAFNDFPERYFSFLVPQAS